MKCVWWFFVGIVPKRAEHHPPIAISKDVDDYFDPSARLFLQKVIHQERNRRMWLTIMQKPLRDSHKTSTTNCDIRKCGWLLPKNAKISPQNDNRFYRRSWLRLIICFPHTSSPGISRKSNRKVYFGELGLLFSRLFPMHFPEKATAIRVLGN